MATKSKPKNKSSKPVKQLKKTAVKKASKPVKKAAPKRKVVTIDAREDKRGPETFTAEDSILATLTLPNPCHIELVVAPNSIMLQIGQRDFQWSRRTGELTGAGTAVGGQLDGVPHPPAEDAEVVEGVLESDTEVFDETDRMLGISDSESAEAVDPNSTDDEEKEAS